MRAGRYVGSFLHRPGQADTGHIGILGKAPVIIAATLAQPSQGSVKGHERGDNHIGIDQRTRITRFGDVPEAEIQQFRAANQPEFHRLIIRHTGKGDIDAGLGQIFDQPLGWCLTADTPVESNRLLRFEQASQR